MFSRRHNACVFVLFVQIFGDEGMHQQSDLGAIDDEGLNLLQRSSRRLSPHHHHDTDEMSIDDRFQLVKKRFMRHYSADGREVFDNLSKSAVTLDYEVQPLCRLDSDVDVFLERGHMDLSQANGDSLVLEQLSPESLFPKVSKYFEVGLDGKGHHAAHEAHHQSVGSCMEFGTITMTPRQVLNSSLFQEMHDYITSLQSLKFGDRLPGEGGSARIRNCTHPVNFMKWHHSELAAGCAKHNLNCCDDCGLQFTVGIDLARVGALFSLSSVRRLGWVKAAVDNICSDRWEDGGVKCSDEYKSLLMMASWTLEQLHRSARMDSCNNPKLAMSPWLVRTHFGDLYRSVEHRYGVEHMKDFQQHVLHVSNLDLEEVVLPNGLSDYLNFPEIAEVAGFVASRDSHYSKSLNVTRRMPITTHEIKELAQEILDAKDEVNKVLMERPCGLWGRSNKANDFTVGDWLEGITKGIDIMSDVDSPISKNSFSGLVWKSMGSWRMKKGDSRIYLECRNAPQCLASLSPPFESAKALGTLVAEQMAEFEADAKDA